MPRLRSAFVFCVLCSSLACAPSALAASPLREGYSRPGANAQVDVGSGTSRTDSGAQRSVSGGQLPFTGMDISAFLVVGGFLLAVGLGLRRAIGVRTRTAVRGGR